MRHDGTKWLAAAVVAKVYELLLFISIALGVDLSFNLCWLQKDLVVYKSTYVCPYRKVQHKISVDNLYVAAPLPGCYPEVFYIPVASIPTT